MAPEPETRRRGEWKPRPRPPRRPRHAPSLAQEGSPRKQKIHHGNKRFTTETRKARKQPRRTTKKAVVCSVLPPCLPCFRGESFPESGESFPDISGIRIGGRVVQLRRGVVEDVADAVPQHQQNGDQPHRNER